MSRSWTDGNGPRLHRRVEPRVGRWAIVGEADVLGPLDGTSATTQAQALALVDQIEALLSQLTGLRLRGLVFTGRTA